MLAGLQSQVQVAANIHNLLLDELAWRTWATIVDGFGGLAGCNFGKNPKAMDQEALARKENILSIRRWRRDEQLTQLLKEFVNPTISLGYAGGNMLFARYYLRLFREYIQSLEKTQTFFWLISIDPLQHFPLFILSHMPLNRAVNRTLRGVLNG